MTRGKRMQCFAYYPAWTVGRKARQQMVLLNKSRMHFRRGNGVVTQPFYTKFI